MFEQKKKKHFFSPNISLSPSPLYTVRIVFLLEKKKKQFGNLENVRQNTFMALKVSKSKREKFHFKPQS